MDPEKYVTFSTSEDFLIAFLIGAPEVVLVTAAKWDSLDNSYSYAEQPGKDNLYDELLRISSRDRTNVELLINTPQPQHVLLRSHDNQACVSLLFTHRRWNLGLAKAQVILPQDLIVKASETGMFQSQLKLCRQFTMGD